MSPSATDLLTASTPLFRPPHPIPYPHFMLPPGRSSNNRLRPRLFLVDGYLDKAKTEPSQPDHVTYIPVAKIFGFIRSQPRP
ncbi:hypothetical protein VTN00DRAFT_3026 [Thermoascus crustaceus]|uniref:uncharacterized protein n=1 Tax=Thermoascus crustaceus TaxID=5088 RepID=UPI0037431A68